MSSTVELQVIPRSKSTEPRLRLHVFREDGPVTLDIRPSAFAEIWWPASNAPDDLIYAFRQSLATLLPPLNRIIARTPAGGIAYVTARTLEEHAFGAPESNGSGNSTKCAPQRMDNPDMVSWASSADAGCRVSREPEFGNLTADEIPRGKALTGEPAAEKKNCRHAVSLSACQRAVLGLLSQGDTDRAIASQLGTSERAVNVYVRDLMKTLGARNRTQAAIFAEQFIMVGCISDTGPKK